MIGLVPISLVAEISSDELGKLDDGPPLSDMVSRSATHLPLTSSVVDNSWNYRAFIFYLLHFLYLGSPKPEHPFVVVRIFLAYFRIQFSDDLSRLVTY